MRDENSFRHYYEGEICVWEEDYINKVKKCIYSSVILGIICIVGSIVLYVFFQNLLVLILLVFLLVIIKVAKNKYDRIIKEYKYELINKIVAFVSNNSNTGIFEHIRISKEVIKECELFNTDKLRTSGSYYTIMNYNKSYMIISDLILFPLESLGVGNEIFSGVYFSTEFNKPVRNQVCIIPNDSTEIILNKFMNYYEYTGSRIILENNEFEKKYNVYSENDVQARYLISLRLMERINDIDKLFPMKKYIVFKKNGKISIFFRDESIKNKIETKFKFLNSQDRYDFNKEMFNYFNKYMELYKILDLENRLYMFEE